ncbi:hypothetical protein [Amycolatopsis magusensis]|uniref:hypothetical protein n=1 Tax=Amycolatopsis magusensis TaxID=882444 RepID=UPI0037ADF21C
MGEQAPVRSPDGDATGRAHKPEELLQRVGNGDEAAFESLYGVIAVPVLGVVVRVLRDREDRAGRMDVRRPFDHVAESTL